MKPLESAQWLFLLGVALLTMVFGMVLEGLPAAVVLIPVVFPIATKIGVNPIHFDIVQTAAVGIGLFLPPMLKLRPSAKSAATRSKPGATKPSTSFTAPGAVLRPRATTLCATRRR